MTFNIDFFEHCQQSNDVEFGGNDVLQVYNSAQVKHRLNTTSMYIASTKVTFCARLLLKLLVFKIQFSACNTCLSVNWKVIASVLIQ